jgi:hypothetical protein
VSSRGTTLRQDSSDRLAEHSQQAICAESNQHVSAAPTNSDATHGPAEGMLAQLRIAAATGRS